MQYQYRLDATYSSDYNQIDVDVDHANLRDYSIIEFFMDADVITKPKALHCAFFSFI